MNSKSSIKKEFDAFASKIARLESLRQQLDALDVHGFEREADVIRGQLNDVNSISAVEKALVILRNNIRHKGGHHESAASHSKLTAQTRELKQELRQDTGSLKKRITELEARINKKKEISNKKQLSKDEVDFVKDVPHLERELHSLHKAFMLILSVGSV
jgi:LPS O-antigen subunit length determinant protein (WzzB/FepE family)